MARQLSEPSDPGVAVRVEHVTVQYPGRDGTPGPVVLDNVSLQLDAGEFICLLGPSGCGKTTLLNVIAGFILPTKGQIWVGDRAVKAPSSDCGVVFQEYALFPWYTVRRNVEFGPRMRKMAPADAREVAAKYIAMVGLEGYEDYYPSSLSGGMKQRAGLARALANRPDALLLDEPFAAVDAMTRDRLQEELLELWSVEKLSCIFVTHSLSEAVFLADRVVVMPGSSSGAITEIQIDIPRPRDRTADDFAHALKRVSDALPERPHGSRTQ